MSEAVRKGMTLHLAGVMRKQKAGVQQVGWKIGFKDPKIQKKLGLEGCCATALLETSLLRDGMPHCLDGGIKVGLEAEIGVVLAQSIDAEMDDHAILAAVAQVRLAIEIVDLDRPLEKVGPILAEGVFHRAFLVGDALEEISVDALAGREGTIYHNDTQVAAFDLAAACGDVATTLRQAASFLAKYGKSQGLAAGDLVILGAMGPLVYPSDGDRYTFAVKDHPPLTLTLEGQCQPLEETKDSAPAKKLSREEGREISDILRELSLTLAQGTPRILTTPPFEPELIREIKQARKFEKDARARQIRRLAALLWHADYRAILQAVDEDGIGGAERKSREKNYERWRTRVIEEGDAGIDAWMQIHPESDRQTLRQLVRNSARERDEGRQARHQTELLRFLRGIGEAAWARERH
jgi:ribosome-associated protein